MDSNRYGHDHQAEVAWRQRRGLARLVRVAVAAGPIAGAVVVAVVIEAVVNEPSGAAGQVAWWIGVLGCSAIALLVLENLAERARPLEALLSMGMHFPGAAPKRLEVARLAAIPRDRARCLEEAHAHRMDDEPVAAAERVLALAASLSAHDRKTRGHAERVRALTELVAGELRLSDTDRDRLRWAALLHDVGKLAVPADILNKEGPLTEAEWHVIRQHPLEGAQLTAPLSNWLGAWSGAIAEHHERYDGGGYPIGLSGESISLGARIISVVDAYDVMTSCRSYVRARSPEAARMELARCAGTQFDPVVVRAFLAIPLRQLRALLPLSWLGSLPFADADGGALLGRAAAGLVAVGAILALTAWIGSGDAPQKGNITMAAGATGTGNSASAESIGTIGSTLAKLAGGDVSGSSDTGGAESGSSPGGTSSGQSGGSTIPGLIGSGSTATTANGQNSGGGSPGSTTTFTQIPGTTYDTPPGTTPPTTGGSTSTSSPPTTSQTSPPTTSHTGPTTTTSTAIGAPEPPTGLSADASCELALDPEVSLSWTRSRSSWVTGYQIWRSTSGSGYTELASLSAGATSYTDQSASGLGTNYTYEVKAVSPEGSAGAYADATTPTFCL